MKDRLDIPDEESIGVDSPDQGTGISCRVSTTTNSGSRRRDTRIQSEPGNFLRCSVGFKSVGKSKKSEAEARVLVFVDPLTGNGTIRIGLWKDGKEYERQIVYETDIPVWKGNK